MGFKLSSFEGWAESMKRRMILRKHSRKRKLAAFVLTLLWPSLGYSNAHAQGTSSSKSQSTRRVFTPLSMARVMPMKGGSSASVHTFKAEDGTLVFQSDDWYKSAGEAREGLEKLTKHASRVVERSTKRDAKGRIIGKRVELVYSHSHKASPEMVIAWVDGDDLVRLRSTSLPLLLDFESQFYP